MEKYIINDIIDYIIFPLNSLEYEFNDCQVLLHIDDIDFIRNEFINCNFFFPNFTLIKNAIFQTLDKAVEFLNDGKYIFYTDNW